MKTLFTCTLAFLLLAPATVFAQDQSTGDVKVTAVDENNQPMPGVVMVIKAGGPTMGGQTDMDGNFTFRALTAGTYDIEANMTNYKTYLMQGIVVNAGQTSYITYNMQLVTNSEVTIYGRYEEKSPVSPLYSTVQNINRDKVQHMATGKDVQAMVVGSSSQVSTGPTGKLVMRGSRETAVTTFVDGEKMYGSAGVPGMAIEQVTILSGGIPASYGDLTGGALIITTRSYYSGVADKNRMLQAAAEKEAAAKKAQAEKNGHKEDDKTIIQKAPAGQTPAPAPGQNPAPKQ